MDHDSFGFATEYWRSVASGSSHVPVDKSEKLWTYEDIRGDSESPRLALTGRSFPRILARQQKERLPSSGVP